MNLKKKQKCKMIFMIIIQTAYFLCELIVGFETNSIALISDAYNMLSDLISVIIGLACLILSKKTWKKSMYGWARAEVMGALVNSVFMIAICLSIFTGSIERLVNPEPIKHAWLLLGVGIGGFVINLIGLVIFWEDSKNEDEDDDNDNEMGSSPEVYNTKEKRDLCDGVFRKRSIEVDMVNKEILDFSEAKHKSGNSMNLQGILLHLLGDALGSLIVVVSALITLFAKFDGIERIDPILSILMVVIILCSTIPLFRQSSKVLLQALPGKLKVSHLTTDLCSQVQGLKNVHEMHVWQLVGSKLVASLHLKCSNIKEYEQLSASLRKFFYSKGIYSTTFQPEFTTNPSLEKCDYFGSCSLDPRRNLRKKSSNERSISLEHSTSAPQFILNIEEHSQHKNNIPQYISSV